MREESQTWGAVALRSSTCSSEPAKLEKKKKVNKETARKEKKKKTKNGNRIVTNANWGLVQRKRKQQKKGENKKSQGGNRQKKKRKKRASDSVCRAAAWENFSSAKQPRYTAIKTHPLTHYQPYNNTKNKNNNNRWVPTKKKKRKATDTDYSCINQRCAVAKASDLKEWKKKERERKGNRT